MKKIKGISLFAGAGGDTLAMKMAGINVICFSEIDKQAQIAHLNNFPKSKILAIKKNSDITKITRSDLKPYINKIDIIFAGFPCQSFSHGGKKDLEDDRNALFKEFVRITNIIKPKFIIGENVKGLLERGRKKGINFSEIIYNEFKKIGYNMNKTLLLSADDFGVPQKRKRVFFTGKIEKTNNNEFLNKMESFKEKSKPIFYFIEDILENAIKIQINDFPYLKKSLDNGDLNYKKTKKTKLSGSPHPYLIKKIKDKEISFGVRKSPTHVEICDLFKPAKTIQASYSFQPKLYVLLRNKNSFYIRTFTIKELQMIQSFPSNFIFSGSKNQQIKQIGNAVPPKLGFKVIMSLLNS